MLLDVPANTGGGAVNSYVAEVVENLGTCIIEQCP